MQSNQLLTKSEISKQSKQSLIITLFQRLFERFIYNVQYFIRFKIHVAILQYVLFI